MKLREGGLLIDWPRQSSGLLPVRIAEETALEDTPVPTSLAIRSGWIHIEIAGKPVLTVEAGEDAQLLRVALECLLG